MEVDGGYWLSGDSSGHAPRRAWEEPVIPWLCGACDERPSSSVAFQRSTTWVIGTRRRTQGRFVKETSTENNQIRHVVIGMVRVSIIISRLRGFLLGEAGAIVTLLGAVEL